MGPRGHVELFHLLFLRVLASGGDRAHYVVKGGCNLRFWFRSVRYSEDLDLDVLVTARTTLERKVDRMLESGPLPGLLRAQGLAISSWSAPKQTDTTQRWKVMLAAAGTGTPLHTKVEFSRRGGVGSHACEAVDAELARRYRVTAPLAHHYLTAAALSQKIDALAHRSETQARDVFDVHLLLTSTRERIVLDAATRSRLPVAIERTMDLGYDDFLGQVGVFLEPEHRELYESRESWNQMQSDVVSGLEALA